jgi:phthalate 4,5-dioxygenase reductase subunit
MEDVKDMTGFWSASSVHFEDFGQSDVAHQVDDKPFMVRIAGTDDTVEVSADQSILEALRGQGYEMPSSCESGTCGTCRCALLEGDPDHRDLVLSDDEHTKYIMVCVSRAVSNELVIELPT